MSVTTDPRSERTSPLASSHVFSGPSFPTIYRREKDNPAIGVQRSEYDDGTVSFMNASTTEPLPSGRREKIDRLAPMPENRRLGYMSVAALIINKMIGTCLMRTLRCLLANRLTHRNWHLFYPIFNSDRHWWQQRCRSVFMDSRLHHHISRVRNGCGLSRCMVIDGPWLGYCYIWSSASFFHITAENLYM